MGLIIYIEVKEMKSIARITEKDSYMELYWCKIIKFMIGKAWSVIRKISGKSMWMDTIIKLKESLIN